MSDHELTADKVEHRQATDDMIRNDLPPTHRYNLHGEWAMLPSAVAAHMAGMQQKWAASVMKTGPQSSDADIPGFQGDSVLGIFDGAGIDIRDAYLRKFGSQVATGASLPGEKWLLVFRYLPFKKLRSNFIAAVSDMRVEFQEASTPEEEALAVRDGRRALANIAASSVWDLVKELVALGRVIQEISRLIG